MKSTTTYIYNKKLEPICSSPKKLKGKTVSYVLRKYLNCNSESYTKLYMKNKLHKQLSKQDIKQNMTLFKTNILDYIFNNKTSVQHNSITVPNITIEINNSTPESITNNIIYITTEKKILLNNGTYISKSSLKNEISKMKRKHKVKNTDSKLENKR